jgi:DUF1680 family protein
LASEENPELMKQADTVIDTIARSQYPNGYLNTYFTLAEPTVNMNSILTKKLLNNELQKT